MKTTRVSFYSLKQEIDTLSLDAAVKLGLRLTFMAIGAQLLILAINWHRLPPEAPLLYSRAYGENQLVGSWWLWLVPGITFIAELISIRLAARAGTENRLWSQMLTWSGTIMALMGLLTLAKIIILIV